jgi:hypothetical protein
MAWIRAHYVNASLAANDLTVLANPLDTSTDFHNVLGSPGKACEYKGMYVERTRAEQASKNIFVPMLRIDPELRTPYAEGVKQISPGQSQATQSRGAALGSDQLESAVER